MLVAASPAASSAAPLSSCRLCVCARTAGKAAVSQHIKRKDALKPLEGRDHVKLKEIEIKEKHRQFNHSLTHPRCLSPASALSLSLSLSSHPWFTSRQRVRELSFTSLFVSESYVYVCSKETLLHLPWTWPLEVLRNILAPLIHSLLVLSAATQS